MNRSSKTLAAGLVAGVTLAGCGQAADSTSNADSPDYPNAVELADDYDPGEHFDWAYPDFAATWDPIENASNSAINFYEPVYDRLLLEDVDGKIGPMLATDYTASEDGKSLTLTLREGLTFSDGTAFDATAVKFNLDRAAAAESTISGELSQVESVEVSGEDTVVLHLDGGIAPLTVALANMAGIMVSPTAAKAGTLAEAPVGIGPYVTTTIKPGDSVEYQKSEGYWDPDAQRVSTMTYYFMPDAQTTVNALKSGELDGARVEPDELDHLADAGFLPVVQPSALYVYLLVNGTMEPFDDPEVRKALNLSLDREAISQGLYDGYCTPQIQPSPIGSPGYSEEVGDGLDIFPYDPDAAKGILESAGVEELSITTSTPNVTVYTKLAEIVQDQLADVGIDVAIDTAPTAEVIQTFAIDKSVAAMTLISTGINDPASTNSRYIAKEALYNPGGADYPELVKFGNEGAASLDPAVRKPAYEKYMDSWIEKPPHVVPICMAHRSMVVTDQVSGVSQRTNGYPDLRGVAISHA
ncbi:ABC transporter substrate-binding protein [Cumulibacter soli]|uniref:ABC transporter substrate-binding protein n=1 Tax=Cumulibacter soli TaxID=2546344 RepID=UPI0014197102|nr:ABC transporter substrate-binding protein [Cumulibacter soli]